MNFVLPSVLWGLFNNLNAISEASRWRVVSQKHQSTGENFCVFRAFISYGIDMYGHNDTDVNSVM